MIDRRHPDGGLRVLISCLFEMLYPSFSFFFRFKIFVFRSCMRIYKYIRCYPGNVSVAFLSRCAVRELIFLSSRNLSPIYREISSHELANFACDLIPLCCKSEAGLMQAMHVNPCREVKLRETSMLLHLQIISAQSDKIIESKLKLLYVWRAS